MNISIAGQVHPLFLLSVDYLAKVKVWTARLPPHSWISHYSSIEYLILSLCLLTLSIFSLIWVSRKPSRLRRPDFEYTLAMEFEYFQTVQTRCLQDKPVAFKEFLEILQRYQEQPRPFHKIYLQIAALFNHDPELLDGLKSFLHAFYPKQIAQAAAAEDAREVAHTVACQKQADSMLLRLPRELRDKIWLEVLTGNVFHITMNPDTQPMKYVYHKCVAPNGLQSSAFPPGVGDHINCSIVGPASYTNIGLVCKQIYLELPNPEKTFYSQNAFQFADLITAEEYLFGLKEPHRASITHLKLALPYSLVLDDQSAYQSWRAINNYFSNPWERKTLHMDPIPGQHTENVKEPIYFYYSDCYYAHNSHRLYKRWQVGLGNVSWDIGISDLKYKGEPKLDLAIEYPTHEYRVFEDDLWDVSPWDTDFDNARGWLKPLLQFRQYDGLKLEMYDETGVRSMPVFDNFVERLQERMLEPVIGPRKCMFFC